jgi:hypothetical protein
MTMRSAWVADRKNHSGPHWNLATGHTKTPPMAIFNNKRNSGSSQSGLAQIKALFLSDLWQRPKVGLVS